MPSATRPSRCAEQVGSPSNRTILYLLNRYSGLQSTPLLVPRFLVYTHALSAVGLVFSKGKTMKKVLSGLLFVVVSMAAYAAGDVVSAVEGSVTRIDAAGKTVTVKTADGTEHTFRIAGRTTVHTAEATSEAAKGSMHGLKEGSDVVVHYTKHGSEETAEEIDRVGEDGLKETKGTLSKVDRAGKKIVVKGDDGV